MPPFLDLPLELILSISDFLIITDFLSLRGTSREIKDVLNHLYPYRLRQAVQDSPRIFFAACFNGDTRIVRDTVPVVDLNAGLAIVFRKSLDKSLSSGSSRVYLPHEDDRENISDIMDYCQCSWDRASASFEDLHMRKEDPEDYYSFTQPSRYRDSDDLEEYQSQFLEYERPEDPLAHPQDHLAGYTTRLFFPIHVAIVKGHIEVVKLLIEHGASIEAPCYHLPGEGTAQSFGVTSSRGQELRVVVTPLYLAIVRERCDIAELLLKSGASTNLCLAGERLSPLHVAVGINYTTKMIQFCIDQSLCDPTHLHEPNYSGLPPIWLAVLNQNWHALSFLQKLGANIDHDLSNGFTPLTYTLLLDDLSAAIHLIEVGARHDIPFISAPDNFPLRRRRNPENIINMVRRNRSPEEVAVYRGLCPFELYLRYLARCALACALPRGHPDHSSVMFPADKLREFLGWVAGRGEQVDINAKDDAGMSVLTSLFEVRMGRFPGPQKNHPVCLDVQSSYTRCQNLQTIFNDFNGDRMATDPHGNTLVELCLWENDFEGCKIVMAGCQDAVDNFSEYWTLDSFMDTFVGGLAYWAEQRKPNQDREGEWMFIVHMGLQIFLDNDIYTAKKVARHPLFPELVCRAVLRHGSRKNLVQILERVEPKADVFCNTRYGTRPLQDAVAARDVGLVKLMLNLGVDPDELNPVTEEWVGGDLLYYCDYSQCKTKAIVDLLVEKGSKRVIDPLKVPTYQRRNPRPGYEYPRQEDGGGTSGSCRCPIPWYQTLRQFRQMAPGKG